MDKNQIYYLFATKLSKEILKENITIDEILYILYDSKNCDKNFKMCINPDCSICFDKSFSSNEKSKYWSEKNKESPRNVYKSSSKKIWFNCDCGHEFETTLSNVTKHNQWCSYCSNPPKKLCKDKCSTCFNKSFMLCEKSKYWSSKNIENQRMVFKGSSKKYWFDCNCGHEFKIKLVSVSKGEWCPYCSNKKLCKKDCKTCFNKSFSSYEKSKYWSSKNIENPRYVFKSSGKKFWFNCICGHEFDISLDSISKGRWCSYCSNPPKKMCDDNECKKCYNKSFLSSKKSKYWSFKNTENPRDVFKSSGKKFWFDCKCGHEIEIALNKINSGCWCPYCSSQKLCDCRTCFNKSFSSNEKSKYLCDNIDPKKIFKNSNNKYNFKCICGHTFKTSIEKISKGTWCPYCCYPSKKLCKDNCSQCFNNSFSSHYRSKYWSNKNIKNPRYVFGGTLKKYWFNCEYGHNFKMSLNGITSKNGWCSTCKNKTEKILLEWLKEQFPDLKIKHQKKFDWCKNDKTCRNLPFDFYVKKLNLIIELDGRQHFEQVRNWNCHVKTRERDVYKMKLALENGKSVIRILQDDVYNNKNKWEKKLKRAIKKYDEPEVIFIDNGHQYELHKI
jgi:very-short-patch-repair endonuclease